MLLLSRKGNGLEEVAQVCRDGDHESDREGEALLHEVHAKKTCTVGDRGGGAGLREAPVGGGGVMGEVDRVHDGRDEDACPGDARGNQTEASRQCRCCLH